MCADVGYSLDMAAKAMAGELDAAIVAEHQFAIPKTCATATFRWHTGMHVGHCIWRNLER